MADAEPKQGAFAIMSIYSAEPKQGALWAFIAFLCAVGPVTKELSKPQCLCEMSCKGEPHSST